MWPKTYSRDITRAWQRVRAVPSRKLQTTRGMVEYALLGEGQPVLMSHGVMGGHPQGLGMVSTYYGDQAMAIAPSRFGYFGSDLPFDATPALQADIYAELLDALGVERAVVVGFSAGGPSTVEFALRHPERVDLLVLASSALPRGPIPKLATKLMPSVMKAALSSDLPFWIFKTVMPGAFRHLLGVPKGFHPSLPEVQTLEEIAESVFPVRPRRDGAVFDAFIGNPWINNCPLEEITPPTLIVHAADDALAPYETAQNAARRMPFARFITIESGGHEFLGHEALVRDALTNHLGGLRGKPETTV